MPCLGCGPHNCNLGKVTDLEQPMPGQGVMKLLQLARQQRAQGARGNAFHVAAKGQGRGNGGRQVAISSGVLSVKVLPAHLSHLLANLTVFC